MAGHGCALTAQFNCPVDINWDYMDSGLFRRFWAAHPDERAAAAPISDNILVFMRGITTVRLSLAFASGTAGSPTAP